MMLKRKGFVLLIVFLLVMFFLFLLSVVFYWVKFGVYIEYVVMWYDLYIQYKIFQGIFLKLIRIVYIIYIYNGMLY